MSSDPVFRPVAKLLHLRHSPTLLSLEFLFVFSCLQSGIFILRMSFFVISGGFEFVFGVLLDPLATYFNSGKSQVGLIGSISVGFMFISSPIIGGLVNKFGMRRICILGAFVSAFSLCSSTMSPNTYVLTLYYGVIGGIGELSI